MKNWIIGLFILSTVSVLPANAISPCIVEGMGGITAAVPSCTDCSGAITFAAHFENNDDIEVGVPCGCADGDTTATQYGGISYSDTDKTDGTYSLLIGPQDYLYFSNNNDNFPVAEGSLAFDFMINTYAANFAFIDFVDGTVENRLQIYMGVADTPNIDIYVWWEGTNSGSEGFYINCNISEGSKYTLVVTWDDDRNPSTELYGEVWAFGGASQASNSDTTITAMDDSTFDLKLGYAGSANGEVWIDNFQMKNSYDETDWR